MAPADLREYVPDLAARWLREDPEAVHRRIEGSMAFVDISGFTSLTERLTRLGVVGSEELSDILSSTFAALLAATRTEGADLVKWGGDAVLLFFDGPDHAGRAARATLAMRRTLYSVGKTRSSAGSVTLRMSVGIHSGAFDFFLIGDPAVHRELIVSGPAASRTAELEGLATAGQIAISAETASVLPPYAVRASSSGTLLLRRAPAGRRPTDTARGIPIPVGADPADVRGVGSGEVTMLLPPPVRAHLLAEAGEAEHRFIGVAFIQFSGTDALLAEHGPQAVAAALDALVRGAQLACAAHGVTFLESDINRDGGKIMLVCGAPGRGENVEDRIVRAVREIIDRAGVLPLRGGVNAGRVFSADFGPTFRRTYSVKGDAINVAARVMGKAAPGQVLATSAILTRVRGGIVTEVVAPLRVKGKTRPIEAALVVSTRRAGVDHERPDDTEQLIGREPEMAVLATALGEARAGRGQYVEVVAPAGCGKSALIRALERDAPDVVIVRGPSFTFGGMSSHQAVRRMLRDVIGTHPATPLTEQVDTLLAVVTSLTPDLRPWFPLLAALLGASLPDTPELADLDDRYRRAKAAEATVTLLTAACPSPTLFVFEGADDMDDASADILERMVATRIHRPWLIVTTRRLAPAGPRSPTVEEPIHLSLSQLGPDSSLALLEEWTREQPMSESLLRAMVAKSGGNPLFLRSLLELARSRGTLEGLPDTVEEVIGAEIDALRPRSRTLLRFASVLGARFGVSELGALVQDDGWTISGEDLRDLSEQVRREGAEGDWYRFSNILVRDVAYAGLPYRLRRQLHLRAGAALEQSWANPVPYEALSTHFFEAGHYQKAAGYSRLAADRARQSYSYLEALNLYQRAVTSARRADAPARDLGDLYAAIGDVADLAGLTTEALAAYQRARVSLRADQLARSQVIAKEVSLHQRVGSFATSLRVAGHARRAVADVRSPAADAVRARLAVQMAFVHHLQGRHQHAITWSRTAVEEAQRSRDPAVLAKAYNGHALVLTVAGVPPDRPYGELALASAVESGDLQLQGKCLTNLAISAIVEGRWPTAEELLGRAAGVVERIGDDANVANVRYNRSDVLVRQGRWAEAEPILGSVRRSADASGDLELVALVDLELGKVRLGQGQLEAAEHVLTHAQRTLIDLGLEHEADGADLALLGCRVAGVSSRPESCDEVRAELESRIANSGIPRPGSAAAGHEARTAFLLGTVLLGCGRHDEAHAAYRVGTQAPPGEGGFERALNHLGVALTYAAAGRPEQAERADAERALARLGVRALPLPQVGPTPWSGA